MTLICDLDGVVYRGEEAVPGARNALEKMRSAGTRVIFATNNSSRTPTQVATKLAEVVGIDVDHEDVVTSAQAALSLIPPGVERCLVVGEAGITSEIEKSGRTVTAEDPECVVVGISREVDYLSLDRASRAVRDGAVFIATNVDPTYPKPTGLHLGAGAIVAAIATASGVAPLIAGKPEQPMRDLIKRRGVDRVWVVGDRIDTDIEMAAREKSWRSVLVYTGVTSEDEDSFPADWTAPDLSAAIDLVLKHGDPR